MATPAPFASSTIAAAASGFARDDVAPLILAEQKAMGDAFERVDRRAEASRNRHFGQSDGEPAVGNIMHGRRPGQRG